MGLFSTPQLLEAPARRAHSLCFLNNEFLILPVAGKSLEMWSKGTARLRSQMPNNNSEMSEVLRQSSMLCIFTYMFQVWRGSAVNQASPYKEVKASEASRNAESLFLPCLSCLSLILVLHMLCFPR